MNPELLTCKRLTAGLLYPPQQLQATDLNRLYAEITERYPYQSLQHLPDGIRMANPDSDCFVQQARVQVNENVMYFQASKEKCMDIFETVQKRTKVQQFLTFGVKLTAFLQMTGSEAASEFMQSSALSINESQWSHLGTGRRGAGMRIVLHQDGIHDVRIEPFFNDLSQLYVELDVQHPQPFNGLEQVEGWMDAAYSYMFTNVKDFIASIA